jgi:hypothetical protein
LEHARPERRQSGAAQNMCLASIKRPEAEGVGKELAQGKARC